MTEIKLEIREEKRKLFERLLGIVHCDECKHKEYCSRSVDMVDPWTWTGTFANVDYCSHGERKGSANGE